MFVLSIDRAKRRCGCTYLCLYHVVHNLLDYSFGFFRGCASDRGSSGLACVSGRRAGWLSVCMYVERTLAFLYFLPRVVCSRSRQPERAPCNTPIYFVHSWPRDIGRTFLVGPGSSTSSPTSWRWRPSRRTSPSTRAVGARPTTGAPRDRRRPTLRQQRQQQLEAWVKRKVERKVVNFEFLRRDPFGSAGVGGGRGTRAACGSVTSCCAQARRSKVGSLGMKVLFVGCGDSGRLRPWGGR